ncbi:UDP-2,4-diacetamido-2,4,6-trideoxy-beta-L-altropyranose hydrolase [Hymenobacter jeollabukensis]|uniref:UDP-2,4-diacetamido-2,4, 6-trideoxy-beta-L-altropyranose hydrolase n=1 Tax=Hymenobacter jeollabukensis TaxID=2025313 RepID=A0A5R8WXA0_9BACT|nr:UDP-2,4-diacetamido-2,4,6-trideoxy-beta-L-altropyranose hydrolase [Hymenobacter jeollabukensis]TLM96824.1 UDP-2,4-diacetamido-2,4,6-trideoxy-beta-L-altropyranose hydrolase [Hymenobacter jeollabukensis]
MSRPDLPRLVLRADGNPRIGLGHVMRLLALADMLRPDFRTTFVIQEPSAELLALLTAAVDEVVEMTAQPAAGEPAWLAQHVLQPDDILILDGYGFEYNYQQDVRPHVARLVCLDDLHSFPSAANLVINPAGGVSAADYDLRQPGARLLSGPAYAPLRPAFLAAAASAAKRQPAEPDTILICLGGADPSQQTQRVAEALLALASVRQVNAVVGSAYQGWDALQQWATDQPRLLLHRNLAAADLVALMQLCGAAVCAPSTVSYEYCASGGGLLFTQPLADNQRGIDRFLREQGLALPYHSAANVLTSGEAARVAERMRLAQHQHFDGRVAERIRRAFAELAAADSPAEQGAVATSAASPSTAAPDGLTIRRATADDARLYFDWANDPAVRRNAVHTEPIEWEGHVGWFGRRLADSAAYLYVLEQDGTPVGQVRIEFDGEHVAASGIIDYSVDAAWRGRGLGTAILHRALQQLRQDRAGDWTVVGQVKPQNEASARVFERLGFRRWGTRRLHDEPYDVFLHAAAAFGSPA